MIRYGLKKNGREREDSSNQPLTLSISVIFFYILLYFIINVWVYILSLGKKSIFMWEKQNGFLFIFILLYFISV